MKLHDDRTRIVVGRPSAHVHPGADEAAEEDIPECHSSRARGDGSDIRDVPILRAFHIDIIVASMDTDSAGCRKIPLTLIITQCTCGACDVGAVGDCLYRDNLRRSVNDRGAATQGDKADRRSDCLHNGRLPRSCLPPHLIRLTMFVLTPYQNDIAMLDNVFSACQCALAVACILAAKRCRHTEQLIRPHFPATTYHCKWRNFAKRCRVAKPLPPMGSGAGSAAWRWQRRRIRHVPRIRDKHLRSAPHDRRRVHRLGARPAEGRATRPA